MQNRQQSLALEMVAKLKMETKNWKGAVEDFNLAIEKRSEILSADQTKEDHVFLSNCHFNNAVCCRYANESDEEVDDFEEIDSYVASIDEIQSISEDERDAEFYKNLFRKNYTELVKACLRTKSTYDSWEKWEEISLLLTSNMSIKHFPKLFSELVHLGLSIASAFSEYGLYDESEAAYVDCINLLNPLFTTNVQHRLICSAAYLDLDSDVYQNRHDRNTQQTIFAYTMSVTVLKSIPEVDMTDRVWRVLHDRYNKLAIIYSFHGPDLNHKQALDSALSCLEKISPINRTMDDHYHMVTGVLSIAAAHRFRAEYMDKCKKVFAECPDQSYREWEVYRVFVRVHPEFEALMQAKVKDTSKRKAEDSLEGNVNTLFQAVEKIARNEGEQSPEVTGANRI